MPALQIILSAVLAVLVLAGISMMSKVRTAVAGNLLSAFAMLCGIVGTLFFAGVVSVWTIYVSILVGALIGSLLAARVQMIQMPQTVALFNGLGGGASALVGLLSVHGDTAFVRFTALLAVAVGMVTLVGSLVAAGKLHRVLPQKPVVWKAHALCTLLFLALTLAFVVAGAFVQGIGLTVCLVGAFVCASLFGLWFSLRVGGADMPITISLLNSLSGAAQLAVGRGRLHRRHGHRRRVPGGRRRHRRRLRPSAHPDHVPGHEPQADEHPHGRNDDPARSANPGH